MRYKCPHKMPRRFSPPSLPWTEMEVISFPMLSSIDILVGREESSLKESLTYMVKHAFEDDQVTCVLADCLKENHASKAVLNGCGFILFNEDETSLYWKTEKESLR